MAMTALSKVDNRDVRSTYRIPHLKGLYTWSRATKDVPSLKFLPTVRFFETLFETLDPRVGSHNVKVGIAPRQDFTGMGELWFAELH